MSEQREDVRAWVQKAEEDFQKLCQRRDALLQSLHPLLQMLNAYSVMPRYPGEEPTIEEAKEAVKIVKEVRQLLRQRLGLQELKKRTKHSKRSSGS